MLGFIGKTLAKHWGKLALGVFGWGLWSKDGITADVANGTEAALEGAKKLATNEQARTDAVEAVIGAADTTQNLVQGARDTVQDFRSTAEKGLEIVEKVTGDDAEKDGEKSLFQTFMDFATDYTDDDGSHNWLKTFITGAAALFGVSKLFGGGKKDNDDDSGSSMKMVIAGAVLAGVGYMLYQNYDKVQEVAKDPSKLTEQFSDKKGGFAPPPEISARFSSPMGDAFGQSATGLAKVDAPKTGKKGGAVIDYGHDYDLV